MIIWSKGWSSCKATLHINPPFFSGGKNDPKIFTKDGSVHIRSGDNGNIVFEHPSPKGKVIVAGQELVIITRGKVNCYTNSRKQTSTRLVFSAAYNRLLRTTRIPLFNWIFPSFVKVMDSSCHNHWNSGFWLKDFFAEATQDILLTKFIRFIIFCFSNRISLILLVLKARKGTEDPLVLTELLEQKGALEIQESLG